MNYDRLSEIGNPLESILEVIDFELFRELLETHLTKKDRKSVLALLFFVHRFVPNYYKNHKKSNLKLSIQHPTPSK